MKPFLLNSRFYIIFTLLLLYPANYLSGIIHSCVELIPHNSYIYQIFSIGLAQSPTVVVILGIAFWLTNNYLWRISLVKKIFRLKDINGRYEGNLISSYTKDDQQNGTYPVVIEISQNLTSIHVNLFTERSCSYSLIANICQNHIGNKELVYVYQNKTAAMGDDSDMKDHNGTAFLEIDDEGNKLKGNYFNNPRERGRYGQIEVKKIAQRLIGKFS